MKQVGISCVRIRPSIVWLTKFHFMYTHSRLCITQLNKYEWLENDFGRLGQMWQCYVLPTSHCVNTHTHTHKRKNSRRVRILDIKYVGCQFFGHPFIKCYNAWFVFPLLLIWKQFEARIAHSFISFLVLF